MKHQVVFNGKFLTAPRTGVQRVAEELIAATGRLLETGEFGAWHCDLYAPSKSRNWVASSRVGLIKGGLFSGILKGIIWEQFSLAWYSRGKLLVNLCNLAPVLNRNALTMIHDMQVFTTPGSYSKMFRGWYMFVQPRIGRRSRRILTVSNYSKQQLVDFGVAQADQIFVLHNGIDHLLRVEPLPDYVEYSGLKGRSYVVALSSTLRHKNIGVLLQAFDTPGLSDTTLVLFGSAGREEFVKAGYAVPANVMFLGRISDPQLVALLGSACAFACPSLTEGFGMPPLEAMILGCPAIIAPCGALPEVCGDAALRSDPQSPESWADNIHALIKDPNLSNEMRQRGLLHASTFTWERAARQLIGLITDVDREMASR